LKLLVVQSSPVPCYFALRKSKYLYQHPVHYSKCLKQLCPSCYATSSVSLCVFAVHSGVACGGSVCCYLPNFNGRS
jgi:hypothetical protein